MSAHSPGPWEFDDGDGVIRDADGRRVVNCIVAGRLHNYLLIAAAPDLLMAISELLAVDSYNATRFNAARIAARAAIAKAEGKS